MRDESGRRARALYQIFYKNYNADVEAPVSRADKKRAKEEQAGFVGCGVCVLVRVLHFGVTS